MLTAYHVELPAGAGNAATCVARVVLRGQVSTAYTVLAALTWECRWAGEGPNAKIAAPVAGARVVQVATRVSGSGCRVRCSCSRVGGDT
jgi:hypothetical protein